MNKKKINHAVIMAAGRGLRMMPLTKKIPKAMTPVLNSTLIAHAIKNLKKQVKKIHVTVGYKGSLLSSHLIKNNVDTIINSPNKSNSWWIYNSILSNLNEPVLVLTCDNIVNENFSIYIDEFNKKKNCDCLIVSAKPVKNIDGDYIKYDKNLFIKSISRINKTNVYASGIQVINPYRLNKQTKGKNFLDIWKNLINQNKIYISKKIIKNWYSIDTIEQLKIFNKEI